MPGNKEKSRLLLIGKGGAKEGMGHLVRLSTLVDHLVPCYEVTLLTQEDSYGAFFLKQKGITHHTYHSNNSLFAFLAKTGKYDGIIIDIYRISPAVIRKIACYSDFIINFDDMQRRIHQVADIYGAFLCPQEPYNYQIEKRGAATIISGTDYFPLRSAFQAERQQKKLNPPVRRLGVILGGAPARERLLPLTQLLDSFLDSTIEIEVLTGFTPSESDWQGFSKRVHFIKNVDNMAHLLAGLDLALIAGGFIKFETLCVGTPFGLLSLCAHQETLARKFASRGYGLYLGKLKQVLTSPRSFKIKVKLLLDDETTRRKMYVGGRQLVDGQGSARIVTLIEDFINRTGEKNVHK